MKNETIVDRVVERLKAQPLGDLITEEDLHDIVKQAIPRTFFEPRRVRTGSGYSEQWVDAPPLVVETMRDLLKESAKEAVAAWLKENPQIIADYWKQVCDEGLLKYVQEIQNAQATDAIRMPLREWLNGINQERSRAGLPYLSAAF